MDTEIFDEAHEIMASRRRKAQEELDKRISEVNQQIPEIKEINNTLFNSGKEVIQLIISSKGKNVQDKIEQIKQRNMDAQNMAKSLLISHGKTADYLNIRYSCPLCSDTGYIESKFCNCMKSLLGKLMTEKLNRNSHIALSSFDTFRLDYYTNNDYYTMQRIFEYTRTYAENFTLQSENILMSGDTGMGKTHLSLAIANAVIRKGFNVLYDSAVNLLWNIEREHYNYERSTDVLDTVLDADLLIIDDLGTETDTKFNISMVYNIINTRIVKNKPTIISTNITDFKTIAKTYGGKVSSRMATLYKNLHFCGKDVRLQIFREKNYE